MKVLNGRFAPSPSGPMHLGNVYCALLSWLSVRSRGGRWLVRVEDLDRQRCRPEYTAQLLDDLLWLGLEWDGELLLQSQRDALYEAAFAQLQAEGLIYPCFCRRADLRAASAPHAADGAEGPAVYAGSCRELSEADRAQLLAQRKPAWRVRARGQVSFTDGLLGPQEFLLERDAGDFIVRRADGNFAYQLAVVVDDALSGITEVVRGNDLLSATAQQLFLYQRLGWPAPEFFHLPLLLAPDGRRLAKRDHDEDLDALRRRFTPEYLIGRILWLAGLVPENGPLSLNDALQAFQWSKVKKDNITVF